jgi:hypothetical protein
LFCLLIFFLEKKNNQGNLYDKLSVSGWQAKRESPETWEDNKKQVPNHVKQSIGACPDPHEITVHFGMRVRCLVFWPAHSDTHGQAELAISQKPANGKLRTLQKNRRNLAPWLCAQVSHGSLSCLREESGRWESHLGAHFGIISLVADMVFTHTGIHADLPSQSGQRRMGTVHDSLLVGSAQWLLVR